VCLFDGENSEINYRFSENTRHRNEWGIKLCSLVRLRMQAKLSDKSATIIANTDIIVQEAPLPRRASASVVLVLYDIHREKIC